MTAPRPVRRLRRRQAEQRRPLGEIAVAVLGPAASDGPALARVCRLCDRSCCDAWPAYAGYLQSTP